MRTVPEIEMRVSDLVDISPEMGWCAKGNHQTYMYEVQRIVVELATHTIVNRVMMCSCGWATVRYDQSVKHGPG